MNLKEAFDRYEWEMSRRQYKLAAAILVAISNDPDTPAIVQRETVLPHLDCLYAKIREPWWRAWLPRRKSAQEGKQT